MVIADLDRSCEYVHVSRAAPDVSAVSTPDWMLYLVARSLNFDALVSRDLAQFDQQEESVALALSGLTMVTWTKPIEDPIVEWGQLLAFGPLVVRRMRVADYQPQIFRLPAPRLSAQNVESTTAAARRLASDTRTSFPEWRGAALRTMKQALAASSSPRRAALQSILDNGRL